MKLRAALKRMKPIAVPKSRRGHDSIAQHAIRAMNTVNNISEAAITYRKAVRVIMQTPSMLVTQKQRLAAHNACEQLFWLIDKAEKG